VEKTTQKELDSYFEIECKMKNQDRVIFETYERKNELESLIYNNKEKLGSSYKNFVKPEDVQNLLTILETANTWLYEEGQNSSKGMYVEKIDSLRPHFEPIARRYQQAEELKESYYLAQLALDQLTNQLRSTDAKHSHITVEERTAGAEEIEKLKQVFANSQKLQATIAGWENPVTSAHEVNNHVKELESKIKKIMGKPVPPPPAPPAPPAPPKEDKPNPANPAGSANGAGDKM